MSRVSFASLRDNDAKEIRVLDALAQDFNRLPNNPPIEWRKLNLELTQYINTSSDWS